MKFDEYTLHARIYPGLICAIPAILLVATFENEALTQLIHEVAGIEIAGKASVGVALFFLLMQLSRWIGKDLFERKLFAEELNFPTTDFLLASNTKLSTPFKATLADKVSTDFGLALPSAADEQGDETDARRRIKDIIARIRSVAGQAPLVLQHNWEYGFARNLVGGSTIAVLLSIIGAIVHFDSALGYIFGSCSIVFAAILLMSPTLMRRYAGHYAQQLLYAFAGDPR